MRSNHESLLEKIIAAADKARGALSIFSVLVLIGGIFAAYFLRIDRATAGFFALVAVAILFMIVALLTVIPQNARKNELRRQSKNPHIKEIISNFHIHFKRNDVVEYNRIMTIKPTADGIDRYIAKLSWQGDPSDIRITSSNGCTVHLLDDPEDSGIRCEAVFSSGIVKNQEHEFGFCLVFDNSSRQIKNFFAHAAPQKPEKNLVLKVSLSKSPTEFIRTIYESPASEIILDRQRIPAATSKVHEWPIPKPQSKRDYRLTWK